MKIVLDTNVLIAAFLTRGTCSELLEYTASYHQLITSDFILKEFQRTLSVNFKVPKREIAEAMELLLSRMKKIKAPPLKEKICRDPDDDWILSTAKEGEAVCIITGDKDLLDLGKYGRIAILRSNEFWKFESSDAFPGN